MEIKKIWSGYEYGFIMQPRIKRSYAFLSTSTIKERVKGLAALSGINRQLIEKYFLKSCHLSEKSNWPFLPPPHCPVHMSSAPAGVQAEGDAGNALRGHLVSWFHRWPGHRLLADKGRHVCWCLGCSAVPLQVRLNHSSTEITKEIITSYLAHLLSLGNFVHLNVGWLDLKWPQLL